MKTGRLANFIRSFVHIAATVLAEVSNYPKLLAV